MLSASLITHAEADIELHLEHTLVDGVAVITAVGEIDLFTAPRLRDAAEVVIAQGPTGLVIDLTGVPLLSSAGMQALIDAQDMLGSGAHFAVVADGRGTSRPLEIVGLTDGLNVVATLDEALAAVTPEPSGAPSSEGRVGRHRAVE